MAPTILIIDDSQDDVLITEMVLAKVGRDLATQSASSGEEGFAVLKDGKVNPALILLDLKMPGMGGIEFLRRIRSDEGLKHIPVVVVTHSSLDVDVKASYAAGADGFVQKAFDMDQFGREIQRALDRWL